LALDVDTACKIVIAVSADVTARSSIDAPRLPSIILAALGRLHWAGGARNLAMIIKGMGPEDDAFVHLTCSGISQSTQAVIFRQILKGTLARVQATRVVRRNVDGFEHWGTGVSMKDGAD
jgi:hypothetical protein